MKKKEREAAVARDLRSKGCSLNSIAKELGVAKSSVSMWVKDVPLTEEQRQELNKRLSPYQRGYRRPKGLWSKRRREMGEEAWAEYQKQRNNRLNWRKRAKNPEKYVDRSTKLKQEIVAYKGGKCEICGYDKCVGALVFHHQNPEEKSFSISHHHGSLERLKKEADKCLLLCSNCHRELHWEIDQERRAKRIEELRAIKI